MRIDIWTDIVCPYCYLGRRRFELALEQFEHRDEVEVQWHSFELDRNADPVVEHDLPDLIAAKYGTSREEATAQHERLAVEAAALGLELDWRRARHGNTFDAHRLVHLAAEVGGPELAGRTHDRLMRAYFAEGLAIGDRDSLVHLAPDLGLDPAAVRAMLDSDDYGNHVRSDEATAKMLGITGVPFFVLDRRYGVSGAQPTEVFEQALAQAWTAKDEAREPAMSGGGCGGCGPDGCGGACSA
ncbi:DsbA family oxidoreductase [Intrasporangium sp. DVR]|uniref:DsbA family oxidoreductase n=1 Tax=Intrasporangium sp. DVR TaxID=3127867 RepID=UPI00313A6A08